MAVGFSGLTVMLIVRMVTCYTVAGCVGIIGMLIAFCLRGRRLINHCTVHVAAFVWCLFVCTVFSSSLHTMEIGSMLGKGVGTCGFVCSAYPLIAFVFWGRGLRRREIHGDQCRKD